MLRGIQISNLDWVHSILHHTKNVKTGQDWFCEINLQNNKAILI